MQNLNSYFFMIKKLYTLLFILSATFTYSQNSFTLKGKILDKSSNLPIESATIYITSVKDSTVLDYTITNKFGNFEFTVKKNPNPTVLKVSFVGFKEFQKKVENLNSNIDFGTIQLDEFVNNLDEIVIQADAPPIRIKQDTLEFNASSFKVRPDSNVQTLLKQLPGVEIDAEGKITVNGKEVNQILVNGKPFFDKDGKIALQNLPSDIINKVQISDTKTKKEEQTGQAATSNNASINLTIDEDKNKGFFGKFMGGYGSSGRYESSALVNYFKGDQKISVLASSNNINSTGFSMNEIFDNMGGGRNSSVSYSSDGSFGINGMRFGGNRGITQSNLVGVNYADKFFKELETSANYFYNSADFKNNTRVSQTNFLPSGNFNTNSQSNQVANSYSHNLNTVLEYKIDSTASFYFAPKFSKSHNFSENTSVESSLDQNNQLLNDSNSLINSNNDVDSFESYFYGNKNFKKKKRTLGLSISNKNSIQNQSDLNNSITKFYQNGLPDDVRNQVKNSRITEDRYTLELEYSEPITDSLSLATSLEYNTNKRMEDRQAFDFDNGTNQYSAPNDFLTNYYFSKTNQLTPKLGLNMQTNKFSLYSSFGPQLTKFSNEAQYLGSQTSLDKNYVIPSVNIYSNYRFKKTLSIYSNYSYESNFPTARQMLLVEDIANPLNTFIGNPNLNPNKYHQIYGGFNNYDWASRSGYNIYVGGSLYDDQIVSSTTFDENRKRTTTYLNVSGTYNSWFGFSYNKSKKIGAHNFKYGFGVNGGFNSDKGFTDNQQFSSKSYNLTPKLNFTYEYGELLTINPTYRYTYNKANYTNYVIESASNFVHQFNIQTTNYWPKNWTFGNDFGYTYNSNIADGFKKDFILLNSSLAYSFYDKKFTAKVKVYDLLNQNQNATRTINATSIRDEENIVLKRYVMFSLTYKLQKFGGKEKKEGNRFMMY